MQTKSVPGFSLMEIMIALAIVATIAVVLAQGIATMRNRANINTTQQTMRNIKNAITLFHTDTGTYPETLKDLVRRPSNEEIAADWTSPYLEKVPKDAWGNDFKYILPAGDDQDYELFSYGSGGKKGSKDNRVYPKK